MSLRGRILLLNAGLILVAVAVVVLGTGFRQAVRHDEAAITEAEAAGAAVLAGLDEIAISERFDAERFLAAVDQHRERLHASGRDDVPARELTLVDVDGMVMASNVDRLPGTPFRSAEPFVDQALEEGRPVVGEGMGPEGGAYSALPAQLPGFRGALLVSHLEVNGSPSVWKMLAGFAALGFAVAGLGLVGEAALLRGWVGAPLTRLTAAMDAVGRGNVSVRVAGDAPPELADAGERFNGMADRLDELGARRRDLEQATEGLGVGLALLGADGRLRWLNRTAVDLLGESRSARSDFWSDVAGDHAALEQVAEALERGEPFPDYEDECLLDDEGGSRRLGLRVVPLLGEEGLEGYALYMRSLEHDARWTDEQRRLMQALSEANQVKNGVFRLLAGDLGARLARLAGQDWETREQLSLIGELGQIEGAYLRALVQECPLAEVVQEALQQKAVLAASRGTNVQVMVADMEVLADRDGLTRMVAHLLGAALYVAEGPVRVHTSAEVDSTGERLVLLEVEVTSACLSDRKIEQLVAEPLDASVVELGPEAFGLALFLATRHSIILRSRLTVREGEEGGLVLGAELPLSPMSAGAVDRASAGVVSLSGVTTDAVTGLASRPIFERAVAEEIHRAELVGRGFTQLLVELEDLSLVNGRHGRGTADRVMRETAELVKRTLRKTDLAARLGHNTIGVLLPDTRRDTGRVVAEKIRWAVTRHIAATPKGEPFGSVSVCVGLASYPESGESPLALQRRAEQALRAGRNSGQDHVFAADDPS